MGGAKEINERDLRMELMVREHVKKISQQKKKKTKNPHKKGCKGNWVRGGGNQI